MQQLICYCFEHSEGEIRREVLERGGHSRILEQIRMAKKAGSCRCAEVHPESR
ncbi:BFD-like [2Fe-2S] binding protein [Geothermobacter ehrlichii]|uniref:BFD-like [2Fe-2S] binding protein n=1 Tax=Geothermobacter ehrlichii TaxID=213224 RepID=A0A5D3WGL6_9BACT|nr:(2Fe-2S)-binding protein [Geothermobacter ehrlichii]TYO97608.1 BFD-like [2Fe-2S] binding protein [Geothermobacter ehrlichii]